jgi:hypothetical protein
MLATWLHTSLTYVILAYHGGYINRTCDGGLERSSIESIVEQEHREFACRIVDDGSTDGTAELDRALTADDPRFHVVEMEHGGLPKARNFGVSQLPPTKYLSFPDADDLYFSHAYRVLFEAAEAFGGAAAHAMVWLTTPGKCRAQRAQ